MRSQKVEAMVHGGFKQGVVIKVRDKGNAYRIRLDTGVEVWAPKDRDVSEINLTTTKENKEVLTQRL